MLPIWLAPLVEVEAEADGEDDAWEPAPEVAAALFEVGLPAVEDAELWLVRVAMLMVWFLDMGMPVLALAVPAVPGMRGTVVEAVPLAETVMLAEAALSLIHI